MPFDLAQSLDALSDGFTAAYGAADSRKLQERLQSNSILTEEVTFALACRVLHDQQSSSSPERSKAVLQLLHKLSAEVELACKQLRCAP